MKYIIFLLVLMFSASISAGEKNNTLFVLLKNDLKKAALISVKHIPNYYVHSYNFNRWTLADVHNKWQLKLTKKCGRKKDGNNSCKGRVNSKLVKYMKESYLLPANERCSLVEEYNTYLPFTNVVILEAKNSETIAEIYFDLGGQCALFNGQYYWSDLKLDFPNDVKDF